MFRVITALVVNGPPVSAGAGGCQASVEGAATGTHTGAAEGGGSIARTEGAFSSVLGHVGAGVCMHRAAGTQLVRTNCDVWARR